MSCGCDTYDQRKLWVAHLLAASVQQGQEAASDPDQPHKPQAPPQPRKPLAPNSKCDATEATPEEFELSIHPSSSAVPPLRDSPGAACEAWAAARRMRVPSPPFEEQRERCAACSARTADVARCVCFEGGGLGCRVWGGSVGCFWTAFDGGRKVDTYCMYVAMYSTTDVSCEPHTSHMCRIS
jgi:hypothetical protein